jgi:2-methylaconitate cis-trans-isomerase PrpF
MSRTRLKLFPFNTHTTSSLHTSPLPRLSATPRYSSTLPKKQNRLPASYYRGGTSRAIIFCEEHLPKDRTAWSPIFCGAIGSPDPNGRQLDGLDGGISSLSKVCIVGRPTHPDADVDYTFAAIGVKNLDVDYSSNCGNMTSAIGPFAVDSGLVERKDGMATVGIHNTNTGKIIHSTFSVVEGEAASSGGFAIDGVAGTAAKIELAFINPASAYDGPW